MKSPHLSRFAVFPLFRLLIFVAAATLFIPHASGQVVEILDPNLNQAVREALELPDEQPITRQEMQRLINLPAENREITDLTGLEYAINLKFFVLFSVNKIRNITPLAGLINLEFLILEFPIPNDNPIIDLAPLSNLTQLTALNLAGVLIKDLTPLSNLTQLKEINLIYCQIGDLTPLSNLTQLTALNLTGVLIKDLTPLSNLTQLDALNLSYCRIRNIAPLLNLTQLNRLNLSANQIVDISPLANLAALKELRIDRNQVVDVSPLANLTQLTDLTLTSNAITDFRPLFGLNLQSVDVDIHKLQELASGEVEIPDPNLERAIREEIGLPSKVPLTQLVISQLIELDAGNEQIADLTGLEHATQLKGLSLPVNEIQDIIPLAGLVNLEYVILYNNPIADLSPLANLTQLESLDLAGSHISDLTPLSNLTQLDELNLSYCRIRDITPLSNLTQLSRLYLAVNQIVDIRPLANLTQLKELRIDRNWIVDFSPIQGLSLTDLRYDEVCVLPDPPIQDRIQNRSLPSIVQSWDDETVNLSTLSREDRISYHDLYWHGLPFRLNFQPTPQGWQATGDLKRAIAEREELLAKNPNMLFLVEVRLKNAHPYTQYPEDWPYWVMDVNGNPVRGSLKSHSYLIDFRIPEVQDIIVQQATSVARCGLYDGIFFDWWNEHDYPLLPLHGETLLVPINPDEDRKALLSILQRIREAVPDDFLIICNSNWDKIPLAAPYINGGFMETFRDHEDGYTNSRLAEIEDALLWYEESLREPQINCLRGEGIPTEPPDGPNNRRWMRLFTTMSLTLSDGYALYITGRHYQEHFWYNFWDANLGQPIGPKAQRYQNVSSLYIREFTNGWAVYNRSGKAQTITLPSSATPVSDRGSTAASLTHLLPDLDGEIYLKSRSLADVNRDGKVNILDLLQVANSLGKSTPDPNGDGVVNSLDLAFIAQQFSQ